jgi:hypothetical protein
MEKRDIFDHYVNDLFSLIKSGRLKVRIHNVYFLEDFERAHSVRICQQCFYLDVSRSDDANSLSIFRILEVGKLGARYSYVLEH